MARSRRASGNPRHRLAAGALAAAIFCLDAFTRDDLAVAGLYVLVPLIAASGGAASRRIILIWALVCAVLSVGGFAISQSRGAPPLALAHLGISLTVLVVTTLLLLRATAMDSAVKRGRAPLAASRRSRCSGAIIRTSC